METGSRSGSVLRWSLGLLTLGLVCACSAPKGVEAAPRPSQAPPGFWEHWGDGQAEIDTYVLVQPRYGELRRGEAVLIYVTETFTDAARVKSDGGHDDEFPVIKLNAVRDFQTGIYDYNAMTSSFVRLDGGQALGLPTKVSLSVQEWCGHVYDQVRVDGDHLDRRLHSYFDGEADLDERVLIPDDAVFADAMSLLVRGLAGSLLEPGEQREVPWLPSLFDSRLAHKKLRWTTAVVSRGAAPEQVQVPLGTFVATRYTATVDGAEQRWWVEDGAPHRLLKWWRSSGEEAQLLGSTRTKYWQQAGEGQERLRTELGLPAPRWPEPGVVGDGAEAIEPDRPASEGSP